MLTLLLVLFILIIFQIQSQNHDIPSWVVNYPLDFHNRSTHTGDMLDMRNDSNIMKRFTRLVDYFLPRVDGFTDGEIIDAIEHYFWGQMNGLALELGSLDGSINSKSMTYEYEKSLNWRRILVEGNPKYKDNLIKYSPKSFSVNAAICEKHGQVHFAPAEFTGGILEFMSMSFMREYHKDIYVLGNPHGNISTMDFSKAPQVQVVDCIPLHTVFHKAKVRHINLFILDVEGGEYEVLKSINFDMIKFDVLCIETDPPNRPKGYDALLSEFLLPHGYINHSGQIGRNIWFTRKDFIPIIRPGLNRKCWNGFRKSDNAEKWWANRHTPPFTKCPFKILPDTTIISTHINNTLQS